MPVSDEVSTGYVIRLLHTVAGVPTDYDERYVVQYDPGFHEMDGSYEGGVLTVTHFIGAAMVYASQEQAIEDYRRSPSCFCHALRDDGEPNRPLTAWNVEILPVELSS